ncbi:uncharacterized protein LOC144302996 [Canis aureus]
MTERPEREKRRTQRAPSVEGKGQGLLEAAEKFRTQNTGESFRKMAFELRLEEWGDFSIRKTRVAGLTESLLTSGASSKKTKVMLPSLWNPQTTLLLAWDLME